MARIGAGVLVALLVISTCLTSGVSMPLPGMGGGRAGAPTVGGPARGGIGPTAAAPSRPLTGFSSGGIGLTRSPIWQSRQNGGLVGAPLPHRSARATLLPRARASAVQANRVSVNLPGQPKFDRVAPAQPGHSEYLGSFGKPPSGTPSRTGMGWSGSVFWPNASGNIHGYLFSPRGFGGSFWTFAYDDVFAGIFWPPAYARSGTARADHTEGLGRRADESRVAVLSPELSRICDDQAAGLPKWSFDRVGPSLQLTEAQQALLDRLRSASDEATDTLRPSCPSEAPATVTGRLEVMQSRIAALLGAVDLVGPPLKEFYGALSDEQKARFNRLASPVLASPTAIRRHGDALARSLGLGERGGAAKGCGDEPSPGYSDRIVQHVERVVQPTSMQRSALNELRAASAGAAISLRQTCTAERPLALPTRLEAVRRRLDGALRAVNAIAPALTKFYDLLSGEQKERFNAMTAQNG